jgi:hypothetical protein
MGATPGFGEVRGMQVDAVSAAVDLRHAEAEQLHEHWMRSALAMLPSTPINASMAAGASAKVLAVREVVIDLLLIGPRKARGSVP